MALRAPQPREAEMFAKTHFQKNPFSWFLSCGTARQTNLTRMILAEAHKMSNRERLLCRARDTAQRHKHETSFQANKTAITVHLERQSCMCPTLRSEHPSLNVSPCMLCWVAVVRRALWSERRCICSFAVTFVVNNVVSMTHRLSYLNLKQLI